MSDVDQLALQIQNFGRLSRERTGAHDVKVLKRMHWLSKFVEILGRLLIGFAIGLGGPFEWLIGVILLAFHLSMEQQFVHAIMHGAYVGLPGAGRFVPHRYETLAVPMQTKTWGQAHALHHKMPSLLNHDPDALHPLYRVHRNLRWRFFHVFNAFLGPLTVFEGCAFNYDRLLKRVGLRAKNDHREILKFSLFVAYQYVLFPLLAGSHWKQMLLGTLAAVLIRNLVASSLQMASSVGHEVSTLHAQNTAVKTRGEVLRFQVETSKNFVSKKIWRPFLGGLDRHIEHHLFPHLPPTRLHDFTDEVRDLCRTHGVKYEEFSSIEASLKDSLSYLHGLSRPARTSPLT